MEPPERKGIAAQKRQSSDEVVIVGDNLDDFERVITQKKLIEDAAPSAMDLPKIPKAVAPKQLDGR